MPLYTYECPNHGDFDIPLPIKCVTERFPCVECGEISKKVIEF